jgi:hypothetical protein
MSPALLTWDYESSGKVLVCVRAWAPLLSRVACIHSETALLARIGNSLLRLPHPIQKVNTPCLKKQYFSKAGQRTETCENTILTA